ncbi:MAG: hypothetical protein ACP5J4_11115 [Anaerolineae bacterium]
MPQIRVGAWFEETGAADKRHVSYAEWLRRPRWERAAMVARDRLQERLDYWQGQWARDKDLPALGVSRG